MRVGFTGTREGLSRRQFGQLSKMLHWLVLTHANEAEFHHGACVGADLEAEALARAHGYKVIDHFTHSRASADMLKRNRDIVAHSDVLIAGPLQDAEELRSGTWATVRYARQAGLPVVMLSR